jgi:hypothetical protein
MPLALIAVAAASVASSAISAHAAGSAADKQAAAADSAAQLQYQSAQNSLAFQEQEWNTQQQNEAPWLAEGKGALTNLEALTNTPGEGLLTPWTEQFQAPTLEQAQNEPGYKFAEQQGEEALQNSAGARGSLLSGNTLEALNQYAQNSATTNYSNVYNRALQQYQQRYGIFENNQTNTFNRLAALSGIGQTAATTLGSEGQAAAGNVSNTYLTSGAQIGQDIQNAAAARASGYVGGANAWSSGLSGMTNNLANLYMMNQMFGNTGNVTSGIDLNSVPDPGLTNPAYYGIGSG